jgi:hypothetical protein
VSGEAGGGLYYRDSAEDEDFTNEWDDPESSVYHARVEAGLEPGAGDG